MERGSPRGKPVCILFVKQFMFGIETFQCTGSYKHRERFSSITAPSTQTCRLGVNEQSILENEECCTHTACFGGLKIACAAHCCVIGLAFKR